MKTKIPASVILIFISLSAFAQDTIVLLNGTKGVVKVLELNPAEGYVSYLKTSGKKDKLIAGNLNEVFSVSYRDSVKVITYKQDSIADLPFSVDQMNDYINGEQFASVHYKAPWVTVGGVAAGTTGPLVLRAFLGFLVPTAYCGAIGISKVHIKKQEARYPELFKNEYFVSGYIEHAKHKKVKNAIWGGLAGLGVGLLTYSVLSVLK
jgi:hypothetical protein